MLERSRLRSAGSTASEAERETPFASRERLGSFTVSTPAGRAKKGAIGDPLRISEPAPPSRSPSRRQIDSARRRCPRPTISFE